MAAIFNEPKVVCGKCGRSMALMNRADTTDKKDAAEWYCPICDITVKTEIRKDGTDHDNTIPFIFDDRFRCFKTQAERDLEEQRQKDTWQFYHKSAQRRIQLEVILHKHMKIAHVYGVHLFDEEKGIYQCSLIGKKVEGGQFFVPYPVGIELLQNGYAIVGFSEGYSEFFVKAIKP